MVSSALVYFAAVSLAQQGLFGKVFKERTGKNGYEEYVMAAELASAPGMSAALTFQPGVDYAEVLAAKDYAPPYKNTIRSLLGSTPLQVRRKILSESPQILALIRQGNAKPVFSPRTSLSPETLLPELAGMRRVTRVAVNSAEAMLANGQSAAAMQLMADTIEMAQRIQFDTVIANLVGVSCTALVLGSFDSNLDRYSEQDWRFLSGRTQEWLASPNPLLSIVDREAEMGLAAMDMIIASKARQQTMGGLIDSSDDAFLNRLGEATPAQLQELRRGLARELGAWGKEIKARLNQSEAHWTMPERPAPVTDAEKLFEAIAPSSDNLLSANARVRTQLRLLRLHALVQIYRWHWNALPDKLDQVVSDSADPLSGEAFAYERQEGGYKLFSKGNAMTGEIQLRYRGSGAAKGPVDPR